MEQAWGEPPGRLYVDEPGDEPAIAMAALQFGNVVLMIQPPRGFGENPVAIYHDPDLAPSHHYLARLPLAGGAAGRRRVRRARRGAPRQARHAGVVAGQGDRAVRVLRAGRGARRPAAGLPVHRERPGGGHPGQAAGARHRGRPPGAADGPGRDVRGHGQARAAARRVRARAGPRPRQDPGAARADLGPRAGRPAAPRPARAGGARRGRVRRLRAAHRRVPLRGQGRADPRRAARARAGPGRRGTGQPRARGAAGRPGLGRAHPGVPRAAQRDRRPGWASTRPRCCASRGPRSTGADVLGASALSSAGGRSRPHRRGRRRPARGPRPAARPLDGDARLGAPTGAATCAWRCWGRRSPRSCGCWSSAPPRWCRGWPGPPTRWPTCCTRSDGGFVPAGPSGLADPRPGQRAADRPQLLRRRPEGRARPARPGTPASRWPSR